MFLTAISTSASCIYHTALPLSPQQSNICELYEQYACPLVRVVHGLSPSWKSIIATFHFPRQHSDIVATWSPCNKFIAVAGFESRTIYIVDAVTPKQSNTFTSPQCRDLQTQWISFSPDSHLLTEFSARGLTSWDLQTGGPVGTIPKDEPVFQSVSSTYSMDGKMIAIAYNSNTNSSTSTGTPTITVFNLLSRTYVTNTQTYLSDSSSLPRASCHSSKSCY